MGDNTSVEVKVTSHIADLMPHQDGLNVYASSKDANGIYTIVDYKRADGILYMRSTLSNPDAKGNYQTDTWKFYDAQANVILTKTWALTYDEDGNIVSKVVA
jgi:hypothetical protein